MEERPTSGEAAVAPLLRVDADSAELRSGIPELLRARGAAVRVAPLKAGDYQVQGRTLVERKTITDFMLSLHQGRLFIQLKEAKALVPEVLLVVEGVRGYFEGLGPATCKGALLSVLLAWRVPVLFTRNTQGTADLLFALGQRNLKRPKAWRVPQGRKRPSSNREEAQKRLLSHVPSVGPALAQRLLDRFGTLGNVSRASREDLCSVEGIGPERAAKVLEVLREPPTVYNAFQPSGFKEV